MRERVCDYTIYSFFWENDGGHRKGPTHARRFDQFVLIVFNQLGASFLHVLLQLNTAKGYINPPLTTTHSPRRRWEQTYRNVEHEWALSGPSLSRKNTWYNQIALWINLEVIAWFLLKTVMTSININKSQNDTKKSINQCSM